MTLTTCRECGAALSTQAATCPNCGADGRKTLAAKKGCGVIGIVVLAFVILGPLVGLAKSWYDGLPESQSVQDRRTARSICIDSVSQRIDSMDEAQGLRPRKQNARAESPQLDFEDSNVKRSRGNVWTVSGFAYEYAAETRRVLHPHTFTCVVKPGPEVWTFEKLEVY